MANHRGEMEMAIVHHMVIVKFKPEIGPAQIDDMFRQLAELPREIPGILYYAAGMYSSPEGLNGGFTHGFLMKFESPAARDAYLIHPKHERIKELIIPCIDGVVAFDFQSADAATYLQNWK